MPSHFALTLARAGQAAALVVLAASAVAGISIGLINTASTALITHVLPLVLASGFLGHHHSHPQDARDALEDASP